MRRPLALVLVAAGTCLSAPAALAQENAAIAEQLFRDGRDLMAEGKTDEACEKFASSQRLAPAIGTNLNLAICREKQGKAATAWSLFAAVEADAARTGDTARARIAHDHGAALAPQLKKVVIEVPTPPVGMVVRLDGTVLPTGALGTEIPLDPGDHDLAVTAPGKKTWEQSRLNLGPSATTVHVRVELEDEASTAAAPATQVPLPGPETAAAAATSERGEVASSAEQPAQTNTKRLVGFAVGGAGVVALGIAGYYGLTALSRKSDEDNYPAGSPDRLTVYNQASTAQTWGFVFAGVGLAAIAGGLYLVFTSARSDSQPKAASLRVTPIVGPGAGGAALGATF